MKPEMFRPNADILNGSGNYLVKCMNNPTSTDKKKGLYRPRITAIKRPTKHGSEITLKVEFSVAKMLYGNNVDEVAETDLGAVVDALKKAMLEMGVQVWSWQIREAQVSAFHPSKNIELEEGYTSSGVISELNKINITKKMDTNKDSFRNEGSSLHLHTNSHELVIYDKIHDLKKPEKRATDKDQNKLQLSLFSTLEEQRREILRLEARLTKKQKMNSVLKELGFKTNPTLPDIFKKDVCQKILLHYWNQLIANENMFIFNMEKDPLETLDKVFRSREGIKPKEAIYRVGLWALSKEGIRKTRAVTERYSVSRTWYRIAKDLTFLDEISDKVYHKWVGQITDALNNFDTFRVDKTADLPCKAL